MAIKVFTRTKDIENIVNNLNLEKVKLQQKNILITGAFGFIGKYILDVFIKLIEENNIELNIYALDNFITSKQMYLNYYKERGINCINHDITNPLNLDIEFHYVISLAGIASPYYYQKYPLQTLNTSILGVQNLFKLNHNKETRFVYFSSSEIYGDPNEENIPTKESYRGNVSSIGPRACYDESKRVGETICYIYSKKFNKNISIVRPFNVYGPSMEINDYRIIPNITRSFLFKEKLNIYDNGKQTRTYCYISDAINGFLKVIFNREKFEIYNIGNNTGEINVLNLVERVEKVINTNIDYQISDYPKEYPADQPQRRCPDISKAIKKINYKPLITLDEGIQNHFEWFVDAKLKKSL
tara:strand:- start:3308 stop:4375 length:1068 start_codon:yes stop_codon:yes gene_type:complete